MCTDLEIEMPYVCSIAGGGVLELDITKILLVEGTIEANGLGGYNYQHAAGSGGFIKVHTRDFEGSGHFEVTGGNAGTYTGGGGGGRLAVYYKNAGYWFGTLNAKGGTGTYGIGGAGTIYLKVSPLLLSVQLIFSYIQT